MAVPQKQNPLPQSNLQWIKEDGTPTQIFYQHMFALSLSLIGPLLNATNDTAAAKAGVPIGGLYRNGNAVQIRLV
jgi:hypothetical protein